MNEHQRLVANIKRLNSLLQERITNILIDVDGVTAQQYFILSIISESPGLSTMDIRAKLPDRFSDASRVTDRMVDRGMIRKEVSPTDRRAVCVYLNDKGEDILKRCNEIMQQETFGIPERSAELLNKVLDNIIII